MLAGFPDPAGVSIKQQATSCDKMSRVNLLFDSSVKQQATSIKRQAATMLTGDKKNF